MKRLFYLVLAAVLLSGCGTMVQPTSNLNLTQTQVVLSSDNFHVVKQVSGVATGTYVLFFGGFGTNSVKNTSVSKMVEGAGLTGAQTIINVTTKTHVRTVLGIWSQVSAVSTGTVIEFGDKKENLPTVGGVRESNNTVKEEPNTQSQNANGRVQGFLNGIRRR